MKKSFTLFAVATLVITILASCGKEERKIKGNSGNKTTEKSDHFIISEIFYTGTWKENGKYSTRVGSEHYIKIVNPTTEVKYLDGLALVKSEFASNEELILKKEDEEIRNTNISVKQIVQFPGSGKDYAVNPGDSVLIASVATDFANTELGFGGKCDFTKANFQYMSEKEIKDYLDNKALNPKVPYMKVIEIEDVTTNFDLDNGIGLIALVKIEDKIDDLSKNRVWNYNYSTLGGHHKGDGTCLKFPNGWVIDAVNLCPTEEQKWIGVSESVEKGSTGVHQKQSDLRSKTKQKDLAGKAVRRKHDGRNFVDTNNSTVDFEVREASVLKK